MERERERERRGGRECLGMRGEEKARREDHQLVGTLHNYIHMTVLMYTSTNHFVGRSKCCTCMYRCQWSGVCVLSDSQQSKTTHWHSTGRSWPLPLRLRLWQTGRRSVGCWHWHLYGGGRGRGAGGRDGELTHTHTPRPPSV